MTNPTEDQRSVLAERRAADLARIKARRPAVYGRLGQFPVKPEVARWAAELGTGSLSVPRLWMAGSVGNGKTRHAWDAAELAAEAGWRGSLEVITGPDFYEAAAPPVDQGLLRRLRDAGLLVLDDLDAVELNAWTRQQLYPIVHWRWQEGLPIILTTNKGGRPGKPGESGFADGIGDRIASRLNPYVPVAFSGPDYRRPTSKGGSA